MPYAQAVIPASEHDAVHRREIMRRARSRKQRGKLLAELEAAY